MPGTLTLTPRKPLTAEEFLGDIGKPQTAEEFLGPDSNYFADKLRRLGHEVPNVIGQVVAAAGSGPLAAKTALREAILWKMGKDGYSPEEIASAGQRFDAEMEQTAPDQLARAIQDVGAEFKKVGPRHFNAPDPARNEELGSAVTTGLASMVPILASGGAGAAGPLATNFGLMGQQQMEDAAEKGASQAQQAAAFGLGGATGLASEAVLGVPAMMRGIKGGNVLPAALGKLESGADQAVMQTLGKALPAIVPVAQQFVKNAVREGIQEGLEQIAGNVIAKDVVGYDPERDRMEGVGMSMLAGGIVGGGVGAAHKALADPKGLLDRMPERKFKVNGTPTDINDPQGLLDTGKNIPEREATLRAQQEQLVAGRRPAQMFPQGTEELGLPKGMERLETPRGVFHYNPAQIDEKTIREASEQGRENEILALGSQSKADVEKLAAQGDERVSVTERTPDGVEVKTAVATAGTAADIAAQLEKTKTPGNVIAIEPIGQVPKERASFLDDLLNQEAARSAKQAEAEAAERKRREADRARLAERAGNFDQQMEHAQAVLANPNATFAEVNGALEVAKYYAYDNSLGLETARVQAAEKAALALEKRLEALKPAEDARRDEEAAAQAALEAKAKARRKAEGERLKAVEKTGRDPESGNLLDLKALPAEELQALDLADPKNQYLEDGTEVTEEMIAAELERRGREEERSQAMAPTRTQYTWKEYLAAHPLPRNDPVMQGELDALAEEMDPKDRMRYFRVGESDLDRAAEMARANYGFADVTTPADVIETTRRMLRGEQIVSRGTSAQVEFAAAKRATIKSAIPTATLDRPVEIISERGKTLTQSIGGQIENEDTGKTIVITRSAEKKQKNQPSPAANINVPEILRTMRHVTSEPDNTNRPNVTAIHRFISATRQGTDVVPIRVTVMETSDGTMLLRHIQTVEKMARPAGTADVEATQKQPSPLNARRTHTVRELLENVKEEADGTSSAEFATEKSTREAGLTSEQIDQELAAYRKEFPQLEKNFLLQIDEVEAALRRAGHEGYVPANAQAAIKRLDAQKRMIVVGVRAWKNRGKGAGLLMHELAHAYWETLPETARQKLRDLHAQEVEGKTGPLYRDGRLQSELDYLEERDGAGNFTERSHKEWFAERTARLNEGWAKNRLDASEAQGLRKAGYEIREFLRRLWSSIARGLNIDPEAGLFVREFRDFLASGGEGAVGHIAGADYASSQGLLEIGGGLGMGIGINLPPTIKNLQPRWQDKILRFESNLDRALYYAGGTNSATREATIAHVAEQTGLSPGRIAGLGRELRAKLTALTQSATANSTVRIPPQMVEAVRQETGTEFATKGRPTPWPENFPNITVMTTVQNLEQQGGYQAAKAGDSKAACDVVFTTARDTKLWELYQKHPQAIIVPVHAEEAKGRNRIPRAFAIYFANLTGMQVDSDIVQSNRAKRTGQGGDYRMAIRATFDGPVKPGREYIIVDDVATMGSSLAALRAHIEQGGGKVVHVTTLAAAQFSAKLAIAPKTRLELETKYGKDSLSEWLSNHGFYNGEIGALTEAEGRWLLRARSLDAAGNRIASARRQNAEPGKHESVPGDETQPTGSVEFATQASEYVQKVDTPEGKRADAERSVEALLRVAENDQLDLFDYAQPGPEVRARSGPAKRTVRDGRLGETAREALQEQTPESIRKGFEEGGDRISSIIPELVQDPNQSWDIRGATIKTARDMATLVQMLRTPYAESTKVALVNHAGEVVHSEIMTIGSVNAALLAPNTVARIMARLPFDPAGLGVIISHNHPSGNPEPSSADLQTTRLLRDAFSRSGIELLDHVITDGEEYFSFRESGHFWSSGEVASRRKPAAIGKETFQQQGLPAKAPWEVVPRSQLPGGQPLQIKPLLETLRQVSPSAGHLLVTTTRGKVLMMERIPDFLAKWRETTYQEEFKRHVLLTIGREGGSRWMFDAPSNLPANDATMLMRQLKTLGREISVDMLDFGSATLCPDSTAVAVGLMEEGGKDVEFATDAAPQENSEQKAERPDRDLTPEEDRYWTLREDFDRASAEISSLQREIKELEENDGNPAEIRARRDQLAETQQQLGDLHRKLKALREEIPFDQREKEEWDKILKRTPEDPKETIERLTAADALPKGDRYAELLNEWRFAKEMRDKGLKVGNEEVESRGQKRMDRAKRLLDEEFPGWEKEAYAKKEPGARRQVPPMPPQEPPPGGPDDGEASPFGEPEKEMPVRSGKANELYGQSAVKLHWWQRAWESAAKTLRGIKGSIPEIPTFGTTRWDASDPFIREHGPNFYDGIKAFYHKLTGSNDAIQRDAEQKVAAIARPLIEAGRGEFNADDYARLQALQIRARKLRAEQRPVPATTLAAIEALQSKLEDNPYVLFNRTVLMLDLKWRHDHLKDDKGNPIRQPMGMNEAEINAELGRLKGLIAASGHEELIRTAVDRHLKLVNEVAEDLKNRGLMAIEALQNPWYFPHVTLEVNKGTHVEQRELRPTRVKPDTEADFRGYLVDPVGSIKPIETDYIQAMYYHLVQVGAHNLKADAIQEFARPYDVMKEVQQRAKELAKQRGYPVSWQQAFSEEYGPRGYVLYGTDSRDAFPTITINRDALARRVGQMLTSEDLHAQLRELGLKGVQLLPEDLHETLMQGQRETWVVPARVAEALRGITTRAEPHQGDLDRAMKKTLQVWKGWKLFAPWNHVRYEFNNMVADLEKVISASPRTLKFAWQAAKELRSYWLGNEPTENLRAAVRENVINTITAQEMAALARLPAFRDFETSGEKLKQELKAAVSAPLFNAARLLRGDGVIGRVTSVEQSAFREGVFRYAKFLADLDAIKNGARPEYAGAYWRNIEAMRDSKPGANDAAERKAAAISKATFGDYGDLSVLGQTLRDKFIPFYSWTEVNFKYHANLLRNLRDMVRANELSQAEALAAGAKGAAVFAAGLTARTAGAIALRLTLPYLAVALWNGSGERDELEKELSDEDRRRFHIIVGRNPDGTVDVIYGATALMDVLKWFNGPQFVQAMSGWANGRQTFPEAFADWRDRVIPDAINNTVGSIGPYAKIPVALAFRKNTFPDVTDAKTIPAYDLRRVVLGQATDEFLADQIEKVVNKDYYASKDLGAWAKQLILQTRRRDPESWAFYEIKDKAAQFAERETGKKRDSGFDAPDQQVLRNFRRAIYRGDVEAATQFYHRALEYGYTAERFGASIRSSDPLSELPKENGLRRKFVESLPPVDREMLEKAYAYYARINASRGREAVLFPKERWGERGLEVYRAQPRDEQLAALVEAGRDEDTEEARADRAIRQSLRMR